MKYTHFIILLAIPMLLIMSGCERKVVNEAADDQSAQAVACFTCHSDNDFALVAAQQYYEISLHATGETWERNHLNNSFYGACERCHTNEGFVARHTGGNTDNVDHFSNIDCFTCHEPHSTGTLGLRVESAVALENGDLYDYANSNICADCHQSRQDVDTYVTNGVSLNSRWGPHHSNQADMLAGTNAYEYAGETYGNSPHTNLADNGCLDCHMARSYYLTGGHSFVMEDTADHQNIYGCHECHDATLTDFDYEDKQTEIQALLDQLETLLVAANLLDDGEPVDRTVATADSAGAVYNWLFVLEDQSLGVHNYDYAKALLESAIDYLNPPTGKGNPTIIAAH